ncbi:MAG: peptidoglycan-binding protein, partial [Oscillospiraceae bacterium]|nr:peptidoglycan-binding protein [Oscillospiraceae bacterium]
VSSEVYPTWEPAAIRANALAVISYALNRVYTEYYRSRGYDFDITNTTARDQKFIRGRNIYENVSELVDDVFNDYIRRQGFLEPLAAKFCNGTTTTCEGLSQWGSQYQALEGANSVEILRSYYGDDIELVTDAPVEDARESYPGTPIRLGDAGENVIVIQRSLERIGRNYPAIGQVEVTGNFDLNTERAVRAFQEIFLLTVDGIVGRATWYQLVSVYVAVQRLAELQSQGQQFAGISFDYPEVLQEGYSGIGIDQLQYMLSVVSEFVTAVPAIRQSGIFDAATRAAVEGFQQHAGLPITGVVDAPTWDELYAQYAAIERTVFQNEDLLPYAPDGTPPNFTL